MIEITEKQKEETLKNFMLEHFDFDALKKAGFYGKEIKRKDYKAQAERICRFFGYKTVFEYRTKEIRCHISYANGEGGIDSSERPLSVNEEGKVEVEPFVTVTKSWLDE
jgi:hypothetical protein